MTGDFLVSGEPQKRLAVLERMLVMIVGGKEIIRNILFLRREKTLSRLQNVLHDRCQKAGVVYIRESKLQYRSAYSIPNSSY